MDGEIARYFRDQFRQARARALQDAEGFQDTIFVLERFGVYLTGRTLSLGNYKKGIEQEAIKSPLAEDIPEEHTTWHSKFATIYETVRDARNDALHQGAFARHLTNSVTQLALVLEDALMSNGSTTGEFMVREPICASYWQPLSFVRQQMLKNSFTYLPILSDKEGQQGWLLVSDYHVAHYLRLGDRKARLAKTLDAAISDELVVEPADTCFTDTSVEEALKMSKGKPLIVIDKEHPERLVGIVAPFDLL
jgi:CBS domain-containing protein